MAGNKTTVTRRDVARAAGVSLTTVTHALNPPSGVRMVPATRERVRRAARRLGYRPSFVGRALVSGRNYSAGLLQPAYHSIYRTLYQGILLGLAKAMEPDDYNLILLFRETAGWGRVLRQGRIDGLFVLESDFETRHIREALRSGLPVVVLNKAWDCSSDRNVGCVQADHWRLMEEAVDELLGVGRRSLALVVDADSIDANRRMLDGFERAVAARGVKGKVLPPAQAAALWDVAPDCDGVISDGLLAAKDVFEAARLRGFMPAREFHLIAASTSAVPRAELFPGYTVYCEQPERMGEAAWMVMRNIMKGGDCARDDCDMKVPYLRLSV